MNERLLQFIWQFQHFNLSRLQTTDGQPLQIIFPGQYNQNQGPDFPGARIRIAGTLWAGSVELHVKTSDWLRHRHEKDDQYRNVVLHVVWEHDLPSESGSRPIPVLELAGRVSGLLLERYQQLMELAPFIPCQHSLLSLDELGWAAWTDRLIIERLIRRQAQIENMLRENNQHWEETAWWLLARSFGARVNAEAFEAMARSLPLTILQRQPNLIAREALLLGQAGLLNRSFKDAYPAMLKREYKYLRQKYGLRPIPEPVLFLRMRPVNFPTIRLAQLAALLEKEGSFFSALLACSKVDEILQRLDIAANDYWHYHFRPDDEGCFLIKRLGRPMAETVLINTAIPLLFAYGSLQGQEPCREKALCWLQELSAEKNRITRAFAEAGITARTAMESQALLELKYNYCDARRCLDCAVGNAILRMKGE